MSTTGVDHQHAALDDERIIEMLHIVFHRRLQLEGTDRCDVCGSYLGKTEGD